ncbi:DUF2188 domain-containing protein [Aquirufa aurantiipilula]|uniref:DUF2188 domain-containing protein n=1 Tax=Aquirufa aurantiipilula TaxID=2696561 RepID=A0ABT6BGD0_9BACT|nr:DUF2188 domain-containing protein [Aquirufa aurantiipilula]MDF5689314.1 DUF2188 domain-containing protein [Aquirufa aurantiipilula]
MTKKSNHVVPTLSGGWSVKKLGTSKAIRNFDSQEKAIEYGQKLSQNQKTDFYIHKKNGIVQNKFSFSTNK